MIRGTWPDIVMPGSASVTTSARKSPPMDTVPQLSFGKRTIVGEKEYEHVLNVATPAKEAPPRRSISSATPSVLEMTPDTKRLQMTRRITEQEKAKLRVDQLPVDLPGRFPKSTSNSNSATKLIVQIPSNDSQKENQPVNGVFMNTAVHTNIPEYQPFKHISNERPENEKSASPSNRLFQFSETKPKIEKEAPPLEVGSPVKPIELEQLAVSPFAPQSEHITHRLSVEHITQRRKIHIEEAAAQAGKETLNSIKPPELPADLTQQTPPPSIPSNPFQTAQIAEPITSSPQTTTSNSSGTPGETQESDLLSPVTLPSVPDSPVPAFSVQKDVQLSVIKEEEQTVASEDTDSRPSSPVSVKTSRPEDAVVNPFQAKSQLPIEISRAAETEEPKSDAPGEVTNPFQAKPPRPSTNPFAKITSIIPRPSIPQHTSPPVPKSPIDIDSPNRNAITGWYSPEQESPKRPNSDPATERRESR